ncbi:type I-C CRISPR-associated protein Cas8c/Csd1 [Shouchella shacheensis]|uniref:type I-C CRISPR-associated protein Cas8c/Csd1 n=1 Tax=Shouchella shacheensis TaxID=1649580 RepID=UPI00073FA981|nr:type I-C CRISPR-associated protein Cas8c/Csd1 [Shouchella shacheensis]
MSWLLQLYETYEANIDQVGKVTSKENNREYTLLPISHTTQYAHIEVTVTEDGKFHSARVLGEKGVSTLIPCTNESGSRSSNVMPHPLHDKLPYVSGDFIKFGGEIKKDEPFALYIAQLNDWAHSPHATPKVKSVYTYLEKGRLIEDLVTANILYLDENQKIIEKWDRKYEALYGAKPPIFSAVTGGQEGAFVRFNVYSPNKVLTDVWEDKDLYDSFIAFYKAQLVDEELCYVSGKLMPRTEIHAKGIRYAGDNAKIISSNVDKGFTYTGRFKTSNEAASISYEVSQKAHNALKWLIHRQGKMLDKRVFLVWGIEGESLPEPSGAAFDFWKQEERKVEKKADTKLIQAKEVAKLIDGYRGKSFKAHVNILILDSATTGRMSVLYYRHMNKELYLDRLSNWHQKTCVWRHSYHKNDGQVVEFVGAPATKDIAFAAYSPRASDKVVKGLMERMLPCVVDERDIPKDIVRSAVQRASNPVSMEKGEWKKTLSIACSLVNEKGEDGVALNHESNDRDYLFGRLLAIAYVLEKWALKEQEEKRDTNAERYMVSFSNKPKRTWKTIHDSLLPYKARLGGRANKLHNLMMEVTDKFQTGEFNDEKLSGTYLLGFSSQVIALDNTKSSKNAEEIQTNESGEENNANIRPQN